MFAPPTRVEASRRVRRPEPQRLPRHDLLALQRSAGNAAVTRMLQRKIGFELESGLWTSAALVGDPTEEHRKDGAIPKTLPTKPPTAREAFYENERIKGTADELPGGKRDVEFVIEERPESQSDDIGTAFDKVGSLYGQLASELPATTTHDTWLWPEARLGWAPPVKHTWLLDKADSSETADPAAGHRRRAAGAAREHVPAVDGGAHARGHGHPSASRGLRALARADGRRRGAGRVQQDLRRDRRADRSRSAARHARTARRSS